MAIAMIILTHPSKSRFAEGMNPHIMAYKGRVFLDAARIESIEEIRIDGEEPLSYVTLRSDCAHTVTETPEQIVELMGQALNHHCGEQSDFTFTATWPPPPSAVSVRPETTQFYDRLAEMHGR